MIRLLTITIDQHNDREKLDQTFMPADRPVLAEVETLGNRHIPEIKGYL